MKVTVAGFGRIGRSLVRTLIDTPWVTSIDVKDPGYSVRAMKEFLEWDSLYGKLGHVIVEVDGFLVANNKFIRKVDEISEAGVLVDATGGACVVDSKRSSAYVTDERGRWEKKFPGTTTHAHFLSTCDGRAILPLVKHIQERVVIISVAISTTHPVMNTQPSLDRGFDACEHPSLERSSMRNLIPKGTSIGAIVAKECGIDIADIVATSFRSPHDAVTAATVDIMFEPTAAAGGRDLLASLTQSGVFSKVVDIAVSGQALGESVVLLKSISKQHRRILRATILYDNELGYVKSVIDEIAKLEL